MTYLPSDRVVVERDLPEPGLRRGDLGTVVATDPDGVIEIELISASGKLHRRANLTAHELRPAADQDIVAVRTSRRWRDWLASRTPGWITFAAICGIFLPAICLIADPIVFRSGWINVGHRPLFAEFRVFAYSFCALAMLCLTYWLVRGRGSSLLAGVFAVGALCSGLLGLAILPFSLIGLPTGVGFLGFMPFFTALVYLGATAQSASSTPRFRRLPALLGGFLLIAVPTLSQITVSVSLAHSLEAVMAADPENQEAAIGRLEIGYFLAGEDRLFRAYSNEEDPDRRARLAEAYRHITGKELEVYIMDRFD